MKRISILFLYVVLCILLSSCIEEDDENEPVVDDSGMCTKFNFNIRPLTNPVSQCGLPGDLTMDVMNKMNEFWGSDAEACSVPGLSNGLVLHADPARIYYDPDMLGFWDEYYNSTLPADIFLAHEYGHVVQNGLNLENPYKELQADCLAGYYMGYENCQGNVSESDVMATYSHFCDIGNVAMNTPWWDTSAHGTCTQRVANLQQGFNGYKDGLLPGEACP